MFHLGSALWRYPSNRGWPSLTINLVEKTMQAHHQNFPELPLDLPIINVAYSPVAVMTVATAKDLIASGELTTNGAKQLFNP
ncbi:hypothetical protein ACSYAD_36640, partial [Acaryochloris marina NIES-2412]